MNNGRPANRVQTDTRSPYARYRGSDVDALPAALGNIRALGSAVPARGDLPDLALMVDLHRDLDAAVRTAVAGFREQGFSWAAIGDAMGISRQSARQRWS